MENQNDKIIADHLKLARSYIFLKREVILLRTERENREKKVTELTGAFYNISNEFYTLKKTYDNIKEMQNDIAYNNAYLKDKIDKLESIVMSLGNTEISNQQKL